LAGDIVPLHDEFYNIAFFRFISDNYKQVFWVPGNHEFYYRNISDFKSSYSFKLLENITILNNTMVVHEGITFIFSTLWSMISEKNSKQIEINVSDFECITSNGKKFKFSDFNKLHVESLEFVSDKLNKTENKVVVVTHHIPSLLCNKPIHNTSNLNEAFCVDLTSLIEGGNASFWIYGHSHFNQRPIHIGKTILLTNQLGYIERDEQEGFKTNAYFSI
jgi:predicted phosphohydrolase